MCKSSLIKVKAKTYNNIDCTTYDSVINSYKGTLNVSSDVPSGTIIQAFACNGRNGSYNDHVISVKYFAKEVKFNSSATTTNATVTVVWLYI